MKNLISIVVLPIVIFQKFGELNAAHNAGSSSGSGGSAPPRPNRPHDAMANYMTRDVYLWKAADGTLLEAHFGRMKPPKDAYYYLTHNYLIKVDDIDGLKIVVYVSQAGRLMAVRSLIQAFGDNVNPTNDEWIIAFLGHYFQLTVVNVKPDPVLMDIRLAGGNKREHYDNDKKKRAFFPDGILFCVYIDRSNNQVQGAFFPLILDDIWYGC